MIRLCMLARDEQDHIASVADALFGLIDDYVVLIDDRTIDNTAATVVMALGEVGSVQRFRFETFAQARNLLFEVAREGLVAGDYLLLADPDSPPRGRLPETLDADVYDCEWRSGSFTHRLPILVRADLPLRYEGACHELLVGPFAEYTPLDEVWVDVAEKPDNPERHAQYLDLLAGDLASPRSAFYYARTLEDLGRDAEAIAAYLRRAQMTGWEEETFLCLLRAGVLMKPLDLDLARRLLERARAYRPSRLEPLHELAYLANEQRRHADAVELALAGLRAPRSTDRLIVNRHAERAGLAGQLALALGELVAAASTTLTPEEAPNV